MRRTLCFIEFQAKCQVYLLGNARAPLSRVALFHFYDGANDFISGPFGAGFPAASWRIKQTIFSFLQCLVKSEQGGWLDDDRCPCHAAWRQKQGHEAEEGAIMSVQIGCSLPGPAVNDQLLLQN